MPERTRCVVGSVRGTSPPVRALRGECPQSAAPDRVQLKWQGSATPGPDCRSRLGSEAQRGLGCVPRETSNPLHAPAAPQPSRRQSNLPTLSLPDTRTEPASPADLPRGASFAAAAPDAERAAGPSIRANPRRLLARSRPQPATLARADRIGRAIPRVAWPHRRSLAGQPPHHQTIDASRRRPSCSPSRFATQGHLAGRVVRGQPAQPTRGRAR